MQDKLNNALVFLEELIPCLESQGLLDSALLAISAAKSVADVLVAYESGAMELQINSHHVSDFLSGSNSRLHQSIAHVFRHSTEEGLSHEFPNLEQKGVSAAVKMIGDLKIDVTKFNAETKQIINDCNDDLILSLMDI